MYNAVLERWSWLSEEVRLKPELFQGIQVSPPDDSRSFFLVTEDYKGARLFEFERYPNSNRFIRVDLTSMIGWSQIDFNDRHIKIVEGVSDFLTVRANQKGNVLGKTTPHLSKRLINVISTVFDSATLLFDNDSSGKKNTYLVSTALKRAGMKITLEAPESNFKDITQQVFTHAVNKRKAV